MSTSPRSLVIGASGQVGEHLYRLLKAQTPYVSGTYHRTQQPGLRTLDIRDAAAVRQLCTDLAPDVIYLPASLTNVEYCESHPDESYRSNVQGVANVVRVAREINAKLVYLSSDYIFDGTDGPYDEGALPNPLCVYGWHKLLAEHNIMQHLDDYLIVRTTVVYGWEKQGKNFVARLVRELRQGERMRVPADQIGSPTYAPDMAAAIIDLVWLGQRGVFHVVGRERASRYEFAQAAAAAFGLDAALLDPFDTSTLAQVAKRPLSAGMRVAKVEAILDRPMVPYVEGLSLMVAAEDTK
jgi:dTDP-4-dehydrorhamnose reductase